MVSIAHATIGALIADTLPWPLVYIPLVLLSHFALDYVKHYDVGVAMKQHRFGKLQIIFWETLDLLGAIFLIALIWQQTPSHFNPHLWIGAFFAILPDIIEATDFFFHQPFKVFKPFYHFHELVHHSTKNPLWGLAPQLILVSVIIFVVLSN